MALSDWSIGVIRRLVPRFSRMIYCFQLCISTINNVLVQSIFFTLCYSHIELTAQQYLHEDDPFAPMIHPFLHGFGAIHERVNVSVAMRLRLNAEPVVRIQRKRASRVLQQTGRISHVIRKKYNGKIYQP